MTQDDLMRQACMTAHDYMLNARADIDKMFGAGHAAKHPELVAAYMNAAATDFAATFGLQSIADALSRGLEDIGNVLARKE
jgi:hypothetical protein